MLRSIPALTRAQTDKKLHAASTTNLNNAKVQSPAKSTQAQSTTQAQQSTKKSTNNITAAYQSFQAVEHVGVKKNGHPKEKPGQHFFLTFFVNEWFFFFEMNDWWIDEERVGVRRERMNEWMAKRQAFNYSTRQFACLGHVFVLSVGKIEENFNEHEKPNPAFIGSSSIH